MLAAAVVLAAIVVAAACVWAATHVAAQLRALERETRQGRTLQVLALLAPAVGAGERDPRSLPGWASLARTIRTLHPDIASEIDRVAGATFPISASDVQAAHAQWTADWLAWEGMHDAEFKRKAAVLEHELASSGDSPVARASLDAVEREKLDLYQRRYAEYVRVAKALQGLSV